MDRITSHCGIVNCDKCIEYCNDWLRYPYHRWTIFHNLCIPNHNPQGNGTNWEPRFMSWIWNLTFHWNPQVKMEPGLLCYYTTLIIPRLMNLVILTKLLRLWSHPLNQTKCVQVMKESWTKQRNLQNRNNIYNNNTTCHQKEKGWKVRWNGIDIVPIMYWKYLWNGQYNTNDNSPKLWQYNIMSVTKQ